MTYSQLALLRHVLEQVKEGKLPEMLYFAVDRTIEKIQEVAGEL